MTGQDTLIVRCAERLVKKLKAGHCYRMDGQYLPEVQVEIERMKKHASSHLTPDVPEASDSDPET